MRRSYAVAMCFLLAGCGSITAPVAVISDNGDTMQGTTTASLSSGGSFKVSGRFRGKPLSCSGTYNALDTAKTIAMPVKCSDGRGGTVFATRDSSGMNGSGIVRLADGSKARFVFGNAALAQAQVALAPSRPAQPERAQEPAASRLPDPRWVAAQSGPYFKCGRDQAIRLAILLPNESPADIATAAETRCISQYLKMVQAVRPRLSPTLFADTDAMARRSFRETAISAALSAREQMEIRRLRPPKAPPEKKPSVPEREA